MTADQNLINLTSADCSVLKAELVCVRGMRRVSVFRLASDTDARSLLERNPHAERCQYRYCVSYTLMNTVHL